MSAAQELHGESLASTVNFADAEVANELEAAATIAKELGLPLAGGGQRHLNPDFRFTLELRLAFLRKG